MRDSLTQLLVPSLLLAATASGAQSKGAGEQDAFVPEILDASSEGADAIARFEVPPGFEVELFAAEPLLANPVCFAIDERGRFYVGETFRHFAGVTDIREHMDWLNDDLQSKTVADRVAMFEKHEGDRFHENYEVASERVRLVVDTDGDGRADAATVFADGFDDPAAGIGAGLLERKGDVYYTCIPDLWLLRDEDGDGRADAKKALHSGFGLRVALLGHDLHGLRMGPDGRLYFSSGDRGFHVETEGRTVESLRTGAVLRCEPDGSGLEVFATGLRNPQELVFDEHGDLFTGDNNSDGGDEARWVWVLEGGDCGWRQAYQWITQPNLRGPWNAEKLWYPPFPGQAAYVNPPIANITSGPSGLTVYPGTGWGDRWHGHFFLCDFRGNPAFSGVHTFRNQPKGAGFELVEAEHFMWNVLVTDVDFGPDGGLYVSDWVDGWNKTGKGRIYRVFDAAADDPRAIGTAALLAEGFEERSDAELAALLGHDDQRVRQEAQFELASRAAYPILLEAARRADTPLARLHGIWGLGQLARSGGADLDPLVELLHDDDAEVRCQAARVLGDARHAGAHEALTDLLATGQPRTRLFAAMALGKLGRAESVGPLARMVRAADDADPWLRYAGIFALGSIADEKAVLALAGDPSPAVRRAVLVVLRRHERPEVAPFLDDPDPSIVAEAARAIYDVPILPAMEALAARLDRPFPEDAERPAPDDLLYLTRRAVCANRKLGGEACARRIAAWLQRGEGPDAAREEALGFLARWAAPLERDPVTGEYAPVDHAGDGVAEILPEIAAELRDACTDAASSRVTRAWIRLVGASGAEACVPDLLALLESENGRGSRVRRAALATLAERELPGFETAVRRALVDEDDGVRGEAFARLGAFDETEAIRWIEPALESPSPVVRQSAFASLGGLASEDADRLLAAWVGRLAEGTAPADVALEILEAAERREADAVVQALDAYRASLPEDDALAAWRVCLAGGDGRSGRKVFFEKAEVSCLKCHKIGGEGGSEAGPDLSDVGTRLTREEILESIVTPNAKIAEGFENWIFQLDDDTVVAGRLLAEDERIVTVEAKEGEGTVVLELNAKAVTARKRDLSSMPEDVVQHLSRRELRDIVEFLAGRE